MSQDPPDRDAPTPRQTGQWQIHHRAARELADLLRAEEVRLGHVGVAMNTARSNLLRHVRMTVEHYAMAFGKWVGGAVPTSQKAAEQSEFFALVPYVRLILENNKDPS